MKREKSNDEQLFEFLNSSQAVGSKEKKVAKQKLSTEDLTSSVSQSEIQSADSRDAADGKEASGTLRPC